MSIFEIIYLLILHYINNSYEILILKFLLLNMQTIFYWFFFKTFYGKFIYLSLIDIINLVKPKMIDFSTLEPNVNNNSFDNILKNEKLNVVVHSYEINNFDEKFFLIIKENLELIYDLKDRYDFNYLIDFFFNFFYLYIWFLLPILAIFIIIYGLHGLLGLYSAYVDYFQKNMDHVESYRAFIPVLFIFILFIFIFFSVFFFLFSFYLIYILWFLYL